MTSNKATQQSDGQVCPLSQVVFPQIRRAIKKRYRTVGRFCRCQRIDRHQAVPVLQGQKSPFGPNGNLRKISVEIAAALRLDRYIDTVFGEPPASLGIRRLAIAFEDPETFAGIPADEQLQAACERREERLMLIEEALQSFPPLARRDAILRLEARKEKAGDDSGKKKTSRRYHQRLPEFHETSPVVLRLKGLVQRMLNRREVSDSLPLKARGSK